MVSRVEKQEDCAGIVTAYERAERFRRNYGEDTGFWLVGPTGCGKTRLVEGMLHTLRERGVVVEMHQAAEIWNLACKRRSDRFACGQFYEAGVLVIDHLCPGSFAGSYGHDTKQQAFFERLLRERLRTRSAVIVTSNEGITGELYAAAGPEVVDLLHDLCGPPIAMDGPNLFLRENEPEAGA